MKITLVIISCTDSENSLLAETPARLKLVAADERRSNSGVSKFWTKTGFARISWLPDCAFVFAMAYLFLVLASATWMHSFGIGLFLKALVTGKNVVVSVSYSMFEVNDSYYTYPWFIHANFVSISQSSFSQTCKQISDHSIWGGQGYRSNVLWSNGVSWQRLGYDRCWQVGWKVCVGASYGFMMFYVF